MIFFPTCWTDLQPKQVVKSNRCLSDGSNVRFYIPQMHLLPLQPRISNRLLPAGTGVVRSRGAQRSPLI